MGPTHFAADRGYVMEEMLNAAANPVDARVAEAATAPSPAKPSRCLHQHPPATASGFFSDRRALMAAIAGIFAFFALAATTANAWLLLRWDLPIQRYVEDHRTEGLDAFFLTMSRFGSTIVVLSLGALFVPLTWNRCRAVAIGVIAATLGRPLLEFVLKELVGRDRPNLEQMVNGTGFSFPSGHVMAAFALWGLLPLVVGLFTRSRLLWWTSVAVSAFLILSIAASRVYLGVHWASDIFAGLLLGSMFLVAVDLVVHHTHRATGCGMADRHHHP
jgi:undecaprenyl-diphosphatase